MDSVWVTFTVEISDGAYYYNRTRTAKSEVRIQVPRAMLESIDLGNLFVGATRAALVNFDAQEEDHE